MHKSRTAPRKGFWAARFQYKVRFLNNCSYSTLKEEQYTENDERQIKRLPASI